MRHFVFSVFDKAAECFGRPFFVASAGLAVRSFSDEVNREDRNNALYSHSGDFTLYELGEFDDSSGEFSLLDVPKMVITADKVKGNGNA